MITKYSCVANASIPMTNVLKKLMCLRFATVTRNKIVILVFAALLLSTAFSVGVSHADVGWQPLNADYHALALSPDRQLILGAVSPVDMGSYLRLFYTGTASAIARPVWQTDGTSSAAFSSDGRYLAVPSDDETITIWRVNTHKIRRVLKGHMAAVLAVAFSADGTTLASSSNDGTIKLWNVRNWKNVATLTNRNSVMYSLAFSPDGTRLAAGALKGHCEIWDVPKRTLACNLESHTDYVVAMTFSSDGAKLATASGDKTAKIWNAATGQALLTLRGHTKNLLGIAFSATTNRVVTSSSDGTVRVWNAATGKELQLFKDFVHVVTVVDFSLDEKTILACEGIKLRQLTLAANLTK